MAKVNFTFKYLEEGMPPKCRKPRARAAYGEISGQLREASKDQAPVALVVREPDAEPEEYRLFEGRLFAKCALALAEAYVISDQFEYGGAYFGEMAVYPGALEPFNAAPWASEMPPIPWDVRGFDVVKATAEDFFASAIAIDGELWRAEGEPAYRPTFDTKYPSLAVERAHGVFCEYSALEREDMLERMEETYGGKLPDEILATDIEVVIPKAVAVPSRRDKNRAVALKEAIRGLDGATSRLEACGERAPRYLEDAFFRAKCDLGEIVSRAAEAQMRGFGEKPTDGQRATAEALLFG